MGSEIGKNYEYPIQNFDAKERGARREEVSNVDYEFRLNKRDSIVKF